MDKWQTLNTPIALFNHAILVWTVFRTAISDRSEVERLQIVDRFYKAYRDEVAANPIGHAMDYVHIILDIEKTED